MRALRGGGVAGLAIVVSLLGACVPQTSADPSPTQGTESSLASFFTEAFGVTSDPVVLAQQQRHMQDAVAECMHEDGFEYVPRIPEQDSAAPADDLPEWGTREFAEGYGYGITTLGDLAGPEPADPNADLLASMSEEGRAEWETALYGAPSTDAEPAIGSAGCLGEAQREVYGGGLLGDPRFLELSAELAPLYEAVDVDPRVVAVTAEWSICMGDAGHEVASPGEAVSELYTDLEHALEIGEEAPAALTQREVLVATADHDCQAETGLAATRAEVERELEEQFVADHRTELEELAADGP